MTRHGSVVGEGSRLRCVCVRVCVVWCSVWGLAFIFSTTQSGVHLTNKTRIPFSL